MNTYIYSGYMEKKTEVLTFRVTKPIRDLLEKMARKEVRSLSQQCEWLVLQKLKDLGFVDEDFQVTSTREH